MARARLTAVVGLNSSRFQRGLRAIKRRWRAFRTSVMVPLSRFGRIVGRTMVRAGVVMGAALVGTIKHASQFRQEMAKVSTMLQKGKADVTEYTEQVIKMSGEFGQAKSALAKGLFDILSSGVKASKGMDVLRQSSIAAVGGSTDVATSVDAITTVLNAYSLAADEARGVSDVLFQVVRDGKIEYEEIAEEIGKVAPTARLAGLSLKNLGAVLAVVVKQERPARAMTAIRAAIEVAAKEGFNIMEMAKRFEGRGLGEIKRAGVTRRAAAGIGILSLNMKQLREEMDKMENSAGQALDAFNKMMKVRQWQPLWQTILGIITRIGVAIDKALGPAVKALTDQLSRMAESAGFKTFLDRVREAAKTVAGIATALARGGAGRAQALKGLKLVFTGIIESAFSKGVALLAKAVPRLAFALGKAFALGAKSLGKELGVRSEVRERVEKQFRQEGKLRAERTPFGTREVVQPEFREEFRARLAKELEETKARNLKALLDPITKEWGVTIDEGSTKFEAGMTLLKNAAEGGNKALDKFQNRAEEAADRIERLLKGEAVAKTAPTGAAAVEVAPVQVEEPEPIPVEKPEPIPVDPDTPAWLQDLISKGPVPKAPEWIGKLADFQNQIKSVKEPIKVEAKEPHWIQNLVDSQKKMQAVTGKPLAVEEPEEVPFDPDTPGWLHDLMMKGIPEAKVEEQEPIKVEEQEPIKVDPASIQGLESLLPGGELPREIAVEAPAVDPLEGLESLLPAGGAFSKEMGDLLRTIAEEWGLTIQEGADGAAIALALMEDAAKKGGGGFERLSEVLEGVLGKVNTVGDKVGLIDPGVGFDEMTEEGKKRALEEKKLRDEFERIRADAERFVLSEVERKKEDPLGREEFLKRVAAEEEKRRRRVAEARDRIRGEFEAEGKDPRELSEDFAARVDAERARLAAADMPRDPAPKQFSELRKIGANIMGAADGPKKVEEDANAKRQKMVDSLGKMEKSNDKIKDFLEKINTKIDAGPAGAVF